MKDEVELIIEQYDNIDVGSDVIFRPVYQRKILTCRVEDRN